MSRPARRGRPTSWQRRWSRCSRRQRSPSVTRGCSRRARADVCPRREPGRRSATPRRGTRQGTNRADRPPRAPSCARCSRSTPGRRCRWWRSPRWDRTSRAGSSRSTPPVGSRRPTTRAGRCRGPRRRPRSAASTTASPAVSPDTAKHTRPEGPTLADAPPVRVSSTRTGAPSEPAVRYPATRIVPSWSATRCTEACGLLTKHTFPSRPIRTIATFGSTVPGPKFTFDATGGSTTSDGTTCPFPSPVASTGVRFITANPPHRPPPEKQTRPEGAPSRHRGHCAADPPTDPPLLDPGTK